MNNDAGGGRDRFRVMQWRAVLGTPDTAKGTRLLRKIGQTLGRDVTVEDVRRYWKDRSAVEASFATPLDLGSAPEAFYEAFRLAGKLARGWVVTGPVELPDGSVDFSAIADRGFTVTGVQWLWFRAADYQYDDAEPEGLPD